MKILFISHNNHQKIYFNKIIDHLDHKSKLISSPFSFDIFSNNKLKKQIDIDHILAIKFTEIDIKYTNKIHNFLYKMVLRLQTPFLLSGYIEAIQSNDADIITFWNGKKYPQNIGVEVTKILNKQTLFFENGALPDTTAMDFYGLNATASIPKDINIYKNYTSNATLNTNLEIRKEEKQRIKTKLDLPDRFIFIPFQVGYDTQIIYHSPWIKTMDELFYIIEKIANKLQINFVFKEHPSDKKSEYSKLHERAKNNQFLNFANGIKTPTLIEKSQGIITINSSVGIEGLLYDKKIITLGDAFYNIESIVKKVSNQEELEDQLLDMQQWEPNTNLIKNFLLYLQEEYLIPKSWRKPNQKHFDTIKSKIERFIDDNTNL